MKRLSPAPGWREIPASQALSEICRLNGGRMPTSLTQCEEAASRLHWRIRILPARYCPDPFAHFSKRVIFMPDMDEDKQVRCLLHELSEIITRREGGEPEFCFLGEEWEHHCIALLVENHDQHRPEKNRE